MKIEKIYPKGFAANTYLVTADGKNAVVVDPAQPRIFSLLAERELAPAYVLLTHAHFDHVGGVSALQRAGAKVLCSEEEARLIGTQADLCEEFGAPPSDFHADETFSDGETKSLCGLKVTAISTPGHTAGGMCYLVSEASETEKDGGRALFTGDTLFEGCVGRTDFPTGDTAALRRSLKKLAAIEGDMPVYPGHDEDTTLETERKTNPYLRDA